MLRAQDGMGSVILQSILKDLSHVDMARGGIVPAYSSEFKVLAREPLRHGRLKGQARWARNSGEAPGRRTTTGRPVLPENIAAEGIGTLSRRWTSVTQA